jgi:Glucosidase II beta subunit-like protein
MSFTNGLQCWGGPKRSARVSLSSSLPLPLFLLSLLSSLSFLLSSFFFLLSLLSSFFSLFFLLSFLLSSLPFLLSPFFSPLSSLPFLLSPFFSISFLLYLLSSLSPFFSISFLLYLLSSLSPFFSLLSSLFHSHKTQVTLLCGAENELHDIQEPNKCEYSMKLNTPAACTSVPLEVCFEEKNNRKQ